eukprot:CAMPEP_0176485582 /NCGR_PEP_ID=MMETSP0200_2-20121128/5114_1 /TAXON_ID=947934 /ORGANISM="Chaetoceros sp., Strain GSL56" /LENGTH=595 /DNA_ID=CAMNT_0017882231 /DNA_START=88 /DNA_END=1875 /DNA_ORIENTATION=+
MMMMIWIPLLAFVLCLLINSSIKSFQQETNHHHHHHQQQGQEGGSLDKKKNNNHNHNTTTATTRPNIIIILADDVGTGDIPVYWNNTSGKVVMPNIEQLAQKGLTFLDAHATPLCATSRYMLLSGNYEHRGRGVHGTWDIRYENNQFLDHQLSIAQVLRDGGNYKTAMFGKWHMGGKVPLTFNGTFNRAKILTHPGHDWSQPIHDGPQDIGFSSSLITPNGIQMAPYSFFRDGYLATNVSDAITWKHGSYDMPFGTSIIQRKGDGDPHWDSSAYNMILVNETEAFIDHHLMDSPNDPFFIYVALGAVHGPHSPPNRYRDGTPIFGTYPSSHMDMLYEMDKAVGSLVDIIDNRGIGQDTMIIFASDNGGVKPGNRDSSKYGHNSHGPLRGHKGTIYEGGHRVPLIARWDGHFPANEIRTKMVSIADIYSTLCEITGIQKPIRSAQDSISMAKYMFSGNHTSGLRKWYGIWHFKSEALREDNLKIVRNHNGATNEKTLEIYDLDNDISETNNLRDSIDRQTMERLVKKMREIGPCPTFDKETPFQLEKSSDEIVGCDFFREDTNRCHLYNVGELNCPTVCGRYEEFCKQFHVDDVVL